MVNFLVRSLFMPRRRLEQECDVKCPLTNKIHYRILMLVKGCHDTIIDCLYDITCLVCHEFTLAVWKDQRSQTSGINKNVKIIMCRIKG